MEYYKIKRIDLKPKSTSAINRRSLVIDDILNKISNDDSDDGGDITNLTLDLISNGSLLIEVLNEPKLVVNFDNFALVIDYNNTSCAGDFDDILVNVLFIESRFAIESNGLSIAEDDNKKLVEKSNSSSNSF